MCDDQHMAEHSVFFAYGSSNPLFGDALRTAANTLKESDIVSTTWEDLVVDGNPLIAPILRAIDGCTHIVAEVSDLNPNVMFEVGYAMGVGKSVLLAYDESRDSSQKNWAAMNMAQSVGRTEYTGNGHKLAGKLTENDFLQRSGGLAASFIAGARERVDNGIFAPTPNTQTQPVVTLQRHLNRKTHLTLLASSDELLIAPFEYYIQQAWRSNGAILHLLSPDRKEAHGHNARMSLFAGFSLGLGNHTVMVAESDFSSPLDYQHLLYNYSTSAELTRFVDTWLDAHPVDTRGRRQLGRLQVKSKMGIKTLGQYVAEDEVQELPDYFVPTAEFANVVADRSTIFIGRKGTGKTATMTQAVKELRVDRRNLVVPIKPTSYELGHLTSVLQRIDGADREFFLSHLWDFLLVTEICRRAILHAAKKGAGASGGPALEALQQSLTSLGLDENLDMAARLDQVMVSFSADHDPSQNWREKVSHALRVPVMTRLRTDLKAALTDYGRVAVVIDNLDKGWEQETDFRLMSQFILSLLVVRGRLGNFFEQSRRDGHSVSLTISIFLRTDIFDAVMDVAREPDKIATNSVQWQDSDQLVRVIEERYAANSRRSEKDKIWTDFFCPEVGGLPTRDYLLWRTLRRPRDLIYFSTEALTVATNRGHSRVEPDDIRFAEKRYSAFACRALYVESIAQPWDLEEICYNLSGLSATVSVTDLSALLEEFGNPKPLLQWLTQASFLAIETASDKFEFVEGVKEARRHAIAAQRWRTREGTVHRVRLHPAFRPELRVRDDDLYAVL